MRFGLSFRTKFFILLGLGTLLYAFANVQRVAIPGAVFDQLQTRLGVPAPGITALGAAFMYVYAAAQLLVGGIVARYGGSRTIMAGCIIFCTGVILFACSDSLALLYLARGITGLGAGTFYLSLVHEVLRVFRKNTTIAVSFVVVIGYFGAVIANAPFTAAVNRWGLSGVLTFSAGAAVLVSLSVLLFGVSIPKPAVKKNSFKLQSYRDVLKIAHNRHLILFSGLNWGIYYVVQTVIGKKFLEDFGGFSETRAAWILSGMGAISAVSGFLFALASRLAGNRRRIFCRLPGIMCLMITASAAVCIALDWHTWFFAVLFCLLSMTASISSILIPLLKETNVPELVPYAVAAMNFCFYAAVAVFGNLAGLLMNLVPPKQVNGALIYSRTSYLAVFIFLALCALPVFFSSRRIVETMGQKNLQK